MPDETGVVEPQPATPKLPMKFDEQGRVLLKINGEEEPIEVGDLERMIADVQRERAADRKWQEAKRMTEEASGQVQQVVTQLQGLLKAADSGDLGAYSQVLDLMGVAGSDKREKLRSYQQMWESDDVTPTEPEAPQARRKIGLEDLDEETQSLLKAYQEDKRTATRDRVFQEMDADIDKDPLLGKLVKRGGKLGERLTSLARERIKGRIRDGEGYGPETRSNVVKELRDLVSELPADRDSDSMPGLGLGPGLSHLEAQAAKDPPRKSINDPGYGENLLARLVNRMRRGSGVSE